MNYQEAIDTLQNIHDVAETRIKSGDARGVVYINPNRLADLKNAISAMQELQQYEKIGTLEEVREAVEKQRKVKPEDGEYCPICHTFLKDEDDVPGFYCMNCGQAIDWGEEE